MIKRYLHKPPVMKYLLIWAVVVSCTWLGAIGLAGQFRQAIIYVTVKFNVLGAHDDELIQECLNLRVSSVPQALSLDDQALLKSLEILQPEVQPLVEQILVTEMLDDKGRSELCDGFAKHAGKGD